MKRTFALLVMVLALLFALAGAAPAVMTPFGGDPIGPVGGENEGEDGDHPWGGDRVLGGGDGSTSVRTARTSVLTGDLTIDVLVAKVLYYLAPPEHKRYDLTERPNSSARTRYRFSLSREAQR